MSTRPALRPFSVITDGDMSGDITSAVTIIDNKSMVAYGISWSGSSPSGTLIVQVSNDYSQNADGSERDAGTWTDLTLDVTPTVSGNTGAGFIDLGATAAYAIRLFYDRTSGTGTLQAKVTAKVM